MRSSKVFALLVVFGVFGVVGLAGCDSPSKPSGETTTFQGIVAGSAGSNAQTGTLSITVQAEVAAAWLQDFRQMFVATLHAQSDTVTATGTLRFAGGSTIALTGTFNTSTKAINLSGGGFTFTGTQSGAVISGTYTGPNGATGAFSSRNTSSGTVTVYCGTGGAGGVFNLVVSNASGAVSGAFTITTDSPPTLGSITGQVTGTALSLVFTATAGRFAGETITATGSIQGGSVSGTIADGNTFSGSTSACQ